MKCPCRLCNTYLQNFHFTRPCHATVMFYFHAETTVTVTFVAVAVVITLLSHLHFIFAYFDLYFDQSHSKTLFYKEELNQ